ncbi:UNVERIFIED_CONTAM: hypothetical protein ABIC26_005251 [Paenibacillus sp. PvR008]
MIKKMVFSLTVVTSLLLVFTVPVQVVNQNPGTIQTQGHIGAA